MENAFSVIFVLLFFIVLPILRRSRAAGKKNTASRTAPPSRTPPAWTPPAERSDRTPRRRVSIGKKDDCDYGEVNHQYSHQAEKRIAQVKGYLKAGLIDEKEYRQMLARYSQQEHWFDQQ